MKSRTLTAFTLALILLPAASAAGGRVKTGGKSRVDGRAKVTTTRWKAKQTSIVRRRQQGPGDVDTTTTFYTAARPGAPVQMRVESADGSSARGTISVKGRVTRSTTVTRDAAGELVESDTRTITPNGMTATTIERDRSGAFARTETREWRAKGTTFGVLTRRGPSGEAKTTRYGYRTAETRRARLPRFKRK